VKRGARFAIGIALVFAVIGIVGSLTIPMKTVTIRFDLPPPINAKPTRSAGPVLVIIEADGRLTIEGKPTTLETLPSDLSTRFASVPKDEQRVMIRAPDDVSYDRLMAVHKSLQANGRFKVGLINVGLINEDVPTPKP